MRTVSFFAFALALGVEGDGGAFSQQLFALFVHVSHLQLSTPNPHPPLKQTKQQGTA
jgi:hypothetical protein